MFFIKNIFNKFRNNKDNLFTILNDDLIKYVCQYLKFIDLIELKRVKKFNNEFKIAINEVYIFQRNQINLFIINLKKNKILRLFKNTFIPLGLISKLPIIEYQDNFLGNTGYLDSIKISNLTHPIMIGHDCYDRPFIVIKYNYKNKYYLITVFQRYVDEKYNWVKSCDEHGPILKMSNVSLTLFYKKQFVKNICQLLNKQLVTVINYDFQSEEINCKI